MRAFLSALIPRTEDYVRPRDGIVRQPTVPDGPMCDNCLRTTVQSGNFRPVCGDRSFECLAEQLKSRRECGEKTPFLQFSGGWALSSNRDLFMHLSAH